MRVLGLLPWDIERLSPAQVEAQLAGWRWRRDREMELMAYFTAWMMATQLTKPPTPDDLLPADVRQRRLDDET